MKKRIALLLALIMSLSLVACGGNNKAENKGNNAAADTKKEEQLQDVTQANKDQQAQVDEAATYKKELIVAHENTITSIDPQTNSSGTNDRITFMYANRLVKFDWNSGEVVPDLAESWEVESGSSYVFHLRKGVKFHNGEEFTADDVVYTFTERPGIVGGSTGSKVWNNIEEIEVIDDYTVRFKLKTAEADFLGVVQWPNYAVLNREACEADPVEGQLVGTGGWAIDSWAVNDFVKFVRFDDSWVWTQNELNPTEVITLKCITEASARTIALQNGEIAAAPAVTASDLPSLQGAEGVETLSYSIQTLYYAFFNMATGIFAEDANLRKAVCYALNYEEIVEYMTYGLGKQAPTMWAEMQFGYFEDFEEKPEYNVDKAKEYLAKSNMPNGGNIKLIAPGSLDILCPLIQAQLKEIGLEVEVTVTDTAGFNATVKENNFEMALFNISQQSIGSRFSFIGDPGNSTNRAHYDNPEMLEQWAAASAAEDEAERIEIYKQIQITLNEDKPYLPLYHGTVNVAWAEGVSGIFWGPDTKNDYTNIRWAE